MTDAGRVRASDQERELVVSRLQAAFAEGRLDDAEFDHRMRTALTAPTHADLAGLTADLPADAPGRLPAVAGRRPGRLAVTVKGSIRRAGRWQVPERYAVIAYKGSGWLDLRAAELTTPVTTIWAVAYKSRVDILVPPGVRVEAGGLGVSTSAAGEADPPLATSAPVVHVRGYSYKAAIEVTSHPPARPEGGPAQLPES